MQGTTSGAVCVDYWSLLHHTIPSRMELDHSRGSHMLKHGVSEDPSSNMFFLFSPWMFLPHRAFLHHEGLAAYSLYLAHQICRSLLIIIPSWSWCFHLMGRVGYSLRHSLELSVPLKISFGCSGAQCSFLASTALFDKLYPSLPKHFSSGRFGWVVIAID
jgi:hypothetical protein